MNGSFWCPLKLVFHVLFVFHVRNLIVKCFSRNTWTKSSIEQKKKRKREPHHLKENSGRLRMLWVSDSLASSPCWSCSLSLYKGWILYLIIYPALSTFILLNWYLSAFCRQAEWSDTHGTYIFPTGVTVDTTIYRLSPPKRPQQTRFVVGTISIYDDNFNCCGNNSYSFWNSWNCPPTIMVCWGYIYQKFCWGSTVMATAEQQTRHLNNS